MAFADKVIFRPAYVPGNQRHLIYTDISVIELNCMMETVSFEFALQRGSWATVNTLEWVMRYHIHWFASLNNFDGQLRQDWVHCRCVQFRIIGDDLRTWSVNTFSDKFQNTAVFPFDSSLFGLYFRLASLFGNGNFENSNVGI